MHGKAIVSRIEIYPLASPETGLQLFSNNIGSRWETSCGFFESTHLTDGTILSDRAELCPFDARNSALG